jgi:hypothetical protein
MRTIEQPSKTHGQDAGALRALQFGGDHQQKAEP